MVAEERPGDFSADRLDAVGIDRTTAVSVAVAALILVAVVVRFVVGRKTTAPWIMTDELIYSELAKSFAESGDLLLREQPSALFSLYPILIAPAWLADGVANAYGIAKAINAVLMTLAAVPVYLWARRLVSAGWALVAVVLTLLMPSFLYAGTLMTENAAFPAFLLAFFAVAAALERPTPIRQLLAVAAIGLASAVRIQGLALLAVMPAAAAVFVVFEWRAPAQSLVAVAKAELRRLWPSLAALVALGLAYLGYKAMQGESLESGLGSYSAVSDANYAFGDATRWLVYHLGELAFSVGVVPACALLVLLFVAVRARNDTTRAERAFLAVTLAALAVVGVQVALFASRFSLRIEERNLFYVAPLLLLALVVWLARGLPRPPGAVAVAVVAPLALVAALPLGRFLNISILSDTLGLIPLYRLLQSFEVDTIKTLLVLGTAAAALVFALLPRRFAVVVLPFVVAVFLAASTWPAYGAIRDLAAGERALPGGGDPAWLDGVADGRDTTYVYGAGGDASVEAKVMWQTEFWNESVGPVLARVGEPSGLDNTLVTVDPATGVLKPVSGSVEPTPLAVAEHGFELSGDVLADHGRLALYRVSPPLRAASSLEGTYGDGWTGPAMTYTRYAASPNAPGRLRLELSRRAWKGPDVPGRVTIRVGPLAVTDGVPSIGRVTAEQSWIVHSGAAKSFVVPTPTPPFRVEVRTPTFSPADFGQADTRELGVQASLRFLPQRG